MKVFKSEKQKCLAAEIEHIAIKVNYSIKCRGKDKQLSTST